MCPSVYQSLLFVSCNMFCISGRVDESFSRQRLLWYHVLPGLDAAPVHPEVELRANRRSISHRCHLFEVAYVWELTKETIHFPLGCLQGGSKLSGLSVPSLLINASLVLQPSRFGYRSTR